MSVQINTLILNTEQELKSFPLNQSIKIKFSEQVEDSQLASCIALIRNLSETGLFNISETYNQSIGYVREKFDTEEINITTETVSDGYIVSIKPIKPLSPGFTYTLFIDKALSGEFLAVSKPVSNSTSAISVSLSTEATIDLDLEILSDPKVTSTTNVIRFVINDKITNTSESAILDLKSVKTFKYKNITISFNSLIYVKGEVFNVLSIPSKTLSDNLYIELRTALTNIKPIETSEHFSSIGYQDILNYYQEQDTVTTPPTTAKATITYTGMNKFLIHLPDTVTADQLDLANATNEIMEAFNNYMLEVYKLYDPTKTYNVSITEKDTKTLLVVVEEIV